MKELLMKLTRRATLLSTLSMGVMSSLPAFSMSKKEVAEMFLGAEDAKVTVIEYASYTCPHCRNFHEGAYKELKRDFIDNNKIKFVYREVYFDRLGLWASLLARCGGAEKFFPITEILYRTQSDWATQSGEEAANALRKIGRIAGIKDEELNACFQDQEFAKALIARYQETATADGVNSTPTFVINGTTYSNIPYEEMKEIITAELES